MPTTSKAYVFIVNRVSIYAPPMDSPNDRPAIWPPYEAFYIQAMLYNARSAMESIQFVGNLLHEASEQNDQRQFENDLLNHLQNIVIQSAALSRYLWPSRGSYEARGQFLRKALGIEDRSPLKDRDLRNRMEHFDEKLSDYLEQDVVGNVYPSYVGSRPETDVPTHMFRAYFLDEGEFEILGKRYAMQPLADEIGLIYQRLKDCDSDGGRFRNVS